MTAQLKGAIDGHKTDASTHCQNCGSYVTDAFARVFGDNKDDVYACLECSTMRALRTGSGVVHD